jgi:hypothetical protein
MLNIIKEAVINSINQLHSNGWDSEGIRRASIHTMLTFQGIIKQKDGRINIALKELVEEGRLTRKDSARGCYYFLVG